MVKTGKANCLVDCCNNTIIAKNLCSKHYQAKYRKQYRKDHYIKNKKHTNDQNKTWYKENKKALSKTRKRYYKKAKGEFAKRNIFNRITNKNIILKTENMQIINDFYVSCPKGMQVDHIIPLKNKYVCGLHTINNLQYLTVSENASKKSSFDFTYNNNSWKTK